MLRAKRTVGWISSTRGGRLLERVIHNEYSFFLFAPTNCFRAALLVIVTSTVFEWFIVLCIAASSAFLAMDSPNQDPGIVQAINVSEYVFAVVFLAEIAAKSTAHCFLLGKRAYLRSGWNVFDLIIVAGSVVSLLPEAAVGVNVSSMRALRALRPLRTINNIKRLRQIVQALLNSITTLLNVLVLAFFVFFIFGVLGCQLWQGKFRFRCVPNELSAAEFLQVMDGYTEMFCNPVATSEWTGRQCPPDMRCMELGRAANPNGGFTNFDNVLWSWLIVFESITMQQWDSAMYITQDVSGSMTWVYWAILVACGAVFILNLALCVIFFNFSESTIAESSGRFVFVSKAAGIMLTKFRRAPIVDTWRRVKAKSVARRRLRDWEKKHYKRRTARWELLWDGLVHYCKAFVDSRAFQWFIIAVLVANTGFLAAEQSDAPTWQLSLAIRANYVFTGIFVVELLLKLVGYGLENYFSNSLNTLDFVVVLLSLVEILSLGSRAVSAFRALRLLRIVKILRNIRSLRKIIRIIGKAVVHTGYLNSVILLYIFVAALIGMQIFGGAFNFPEGVPRANFDGIFWAMITVFQVLTRDNWPDVMYSGMRSHGSVACLYFIVLVVIGDFIILNLFMAILIQSFSTFQKFKDKGTKAGDGAPARAAELSDSDGSSYLSDSSDVSFSMGSDSPFPSSVSPRTERKFSIDSGKKSSSSRRSSLKYQPRFPSADNLSEESPRDKRAEEATPWEFTFGGLKFGADEGIQRGSGSGGEEDPGDALSRTGDFKKRLSRLASQKNSPAPIPLFPLEALKSPKEQAGDDLKTVKSKAALRAGIKEDVEDPRDSTESRSESKSPLTLESIGRASISFTPSVLGDQQPIPLSRTLGHAIRAGPAFINLASPLLTPKLSKADEEELRGSIPLQFTAEGRIVGSAAIAMALVPTAHALEHVSLFIFGPRNRLRRWVTRVVFNWWFENFVLVCVALSCITLAFDNPHRPVGEPYGSIFDAANLVFTAFFCAEIALKSLAKGAVLHRGAYLRDPWNFMDFAIVLISAATIPFSSQLASLKAARTLRALRPLRMIKRARGLRVVAQTLIQAVPGIGNVVGISTIVFLLFGILGVQLFSQGTRRCSDARVVSKADCKGSFFVLDDVIGLRAWIDTRAGFRNILQSSLTLFQISTLEQWTGIMFDTVDGGKDEFYRDRNPWVALFFVIFIVVTGFFVLNLFVGVIVFNFKMVRRKLDHTLLMSEEQSLWSETERIMLKFKCKPRPTARNSRMSRRLFWFTQHPWFSSVIAALIVANTGFLACDQYDQSAATEAALQYANYAFTAVFCLEAILKFVAYNSLAFGWNRFDALVALTSAIGIVVDLFSTTSLLLNPTILRVFRIFRVMRVLRLIKNSRNVRVLLETMFFSLPAMGNIGAFMLMLYFTFSIIGVNLFGGVRRGYTMGYHYNFRTWGDAMIVLFVMTTLDGWDLVMLDCMRQDGCTDQSPLLDPLTQQPLQPFSDCGTYLAPAYFIIFVILSAYVMLNLLVAIILDAFITTMAIEKSNLKLSSLAHFVDVWSVFDPRGSHVIETSKFPRLLKAIGPPLGVPQDCSRRELLRIVNDYEIPDHGGTIHFIETLIPLARCVMDFRPTAKEKKLQERKLVSRYPEIEHLPVLMYRKRKASVEHYLASTYISAAYRGMKDRQKSKSMFGDEGLFQGTLADLIRQRTGKRASVGPEQGEGDPPLPAPLTSGVRGGIVKAGALLLSPSDAELEQNRESFEEALAMFPRGRFPLPHTVAESP